MKPRTVTWKEVSSQITSFESSYAKNKERARKFVKFAIPGDQWDDGQENKRRIANKESMVFNLCLKQLTRMRAQAEDIEFSVDISPTNKEVQEDVAASTASKLLLNSIVLGGNVTRNNNDALEKCCEAGYSFLEVNFARESEKTLNCIPVTILHKDPSIAFWDLNAMDPTKIDGHFCGINKVLSKREVICTYPILRGPEKESYYNITASYNKVVDYWYRDKTLADFVLLNTGIYKRKDCLTVDDESNLMTKQGAARYESDNSIDAGDLPLVKQDYISCIYFMRFLNEKVLENPKKFPLDDLPLVFHHGLTFWDPDDTDFTMPLVYPMEGAQKLHNYLNSQVATQAKNISADKYFLGSEHVVTQQAKQNAKKVNTHEGALIFDGNVGTIRRESGGQLSQTLLEASQMVKAEMDEIGGAMMETQSAQNAVISGVALDKITRNMNVFNKHIIGKHIVFVNTIGKLFKQMIPKIITEQRTMVSKNKDGSGQVIIINEVLPTGEIKNSVKDFTDNYDWSISASPDFTMQKENTVRYLSQILSLNPQLLTLFGDMYARCLDTPDAGELERRFASQIDPSLIQFSQGMITEQQYKEAQQQSQQQKQQQQVEASQLDPQVQAANAMASAEHRKAAAKEQDSITNRLKVLEDSVQERNKLIVALANLASKSNQFEKQHANEQIQTQLDINDQMISSFKDAAENVESQVSQQDQQNQQNQQQQQGGQPPQEQQGGMDNAAATAD